MSRVDRKLKKFAMALGFIAASGLVAGTAFATVPVSITQQGRILQSNGEPLQGNQSLEFALYDSASGGTQLWGDSMTADLGDNGVYSVTLGTSTQPIDADLLSGGTVYLELTAGGSAMNPRLELTSVPFSALAEVALNVADGSITSAALAPGAVTWNQISDVPSSVTADTLAGLSCSGSQIAIYDGSNWGCGNLPASGGTYDGSDFALSNQSCSGDQIAVGISSSGALVCDDAPEGTTYSAGTGLTLNNTTFATDNTYLDNRYHNRNQNMAMGTYDITFGYSPSVCFNGLCTLPAYGRLHFRDVTLYGAQTDQLRLTGGSFTIASGRLGINRTTPQLPLHVKQQVANYGIAIEHESSQAGWGIGIGTSTHNLRFVYNSSSVGASGTLRGALDSSTGAWHSYSDERLKADVEYLDGVLDGVRSLQAASYRYADAADESRRTVGFMAQQVMEYFPELVYMDEESEYYGLAYNDFAVLAIQAIGEQQEIIDAQAQELEQLRREQASIEERLSRLEAGR